MRSMVLAVVAALSVSVGAAQATSGSGQVHFDFTGFSGPFALATPGHVGDPAAWSLTGAVNGAIPTIDGVNGLDVNGNTYIGGTTALSGNSVTMVYSNSLSAVPSVVTFTPDSFTGVSTGEAFRLGVLSYANGQWVGGGPTPATNLPVTLSFNLTTTSSTPAFNQGLSDSFTIVTNQAGGDCSSLNGQRNEADFIYLTSHPQFGSLRVFDQFCKPAGATNVGTVELWAAFGSLDLNNFRHPGGSGFLVDSTGIGAIGGAPEPGAWALMITGLGLVGAAVRRRRSGGAVPVHA